MREVEGVEGVEGVEEVELASQRPGYEVIKKWGQVLLGPIFLCLAGLFGY